MDRTGTFPSRRTLLSVSALAGVAVAGSSALRNAVLPPPQAGHDAGESGTPKEPRGYRLSPHVARYYLTTRI
jgi:hypothetical protein